jgi:hypothetical protein
MPAAADCHCYLIQCQGRYRHDPAALPIEQHPAHDALSARCSKELEIKIILICSTNSASMTPKRALMISAPRAIRNGLAGAPNPLQNCEA